MSGAEFLLGAAKIPRLGEIHALVIEPGRRQAFLAGLIALAQDFHQPLV